MEREGRGGGGGGERKGGGGGEQEERGIGNCEQGSRARRAASRIKQQGDSPYHIWRWQLREARWSSRVGTSGIE